MRSNRDLLLGLVAVTSLLLIGCVRPADTGGTDGSDDDDDGPSLTAPNGWPNGSLPSDYPEETGTSVGDYAPSMRGQQDQHGNDDVSLGQFYGQIVILNFGAVWCPPCNQAAETSQQLVDELNDHFGSDVTVTEVELLIDDANPGATPDGGYATLADAENWADDYGIEFPVLAGRPAWRQGEIWNVLSLPTIWILDPTFKIRSVVEGFPGDQAIEDMVIDAFDAFTEENPNWENPWDQ